MQTLQESPCFSAQLDTPALPLTKRGVQKAKLSPGGTILTLGFWCLRVAVLLSRDLVSGLHSQWKPIE